MADTVWGRTDRPVDEVVDGAEPAGRREDARVVLAMMGRVTGVAPVVWSASIIGFGQSHYRYESGREGEEFIVGFAPRRASMVLYGLFGPESGPLLERLGPFRRGVVCLYLGRLGKVDLDVLEQLTVQAWQRGGAPTA